MTRARWAVAGLAAALTIPGAVVGIDLTRAERVETIAVVVTLAAGLQVLQHVAVTVTTGPTRHALMLAGDLSLGLLALSMIDVPVGSIGTAVLAVPVAAAGLRFGYGGALVAWATAAFVVGSDAIWTDADSGFDPGGLATSMVIVLLVGASISVLGEKLIDEIARITAISSRGVARSEPTVIRSGPIDGVAVASRTVQIGHEKAMTSMFDAVARSEASERLGRSIDIIDVHRRDDVDRSGIHDGFGDLVDVVIQRRLLSAVGQAGFVVMTGPDSYLVVTDSAVVASESVERSVRSQLRSSVRLDDGSNTSLSVDVGTSQPATAREVVAAMRRASRRESSHH